MCEKCVLKGAFNAEVEQLKTSVLSYITESLGFFQLKTHMLIFDHFHHVYKTVFRPVDLTFKCNYLSVAYS